MSITLWKILYFIHSCVVLNIDDDQEGSTHAELHRKTVANAFWSYQVEEELTEENDRTHIITGSSSHNEYMDEVDKRRATSVYSHEQCSMECQKRGLL